MFKDNQPGWTQNSVLVSVSNFLSVLVWCAASKVFNNAGGALMKIFVGREGRGEYVLSTSIYYIDSFPQKYKTPLLFYKL
jgi:hypothetical protein